MSELVSFRDGGKTNERGIAQFLDKLFWGEVITGLNVTQQGSPAMGVTVAIGSAFIPSGNSYPYCVFTDASYNITINTADGSNPRIDLIVAYVDLTVVSSTNPNNPAALKLTKVTGTPAGSPTVPNVAAIQAVIGASNPYIILARVAVAAGATTITNSNITDVRVIVPTKYNNPYKFRAYRNAAYISVDGVPTVMPFDTESFDSNNNFDVTTNVGRYTVPVSGFYQINASINSDHSGFLIIYLFKNGSQIAKGGADFYDPNQFTGVSLSDSIQVTAGDYLEIVYYTNGASNVEVGSGAQTRFSGYLICTI